MFAGLAKPEYLYRPSQLLRRLRQTLTGGGAGDERVVTLPWGWPIAVNPAEDIGRVICALGVYDLVVGETILRLLEPGEDAADIGANIGYMSAVMSACAKSGRVHAFEPHPVLFDRLKRNADRWRGLAGAAAITCNQLALSDRGGEAILSVPTDFANNQGTATLGSGASAPGAMSIAVKTTTLDDYAGAAFGLIKMDVEGHELAVLSGASRLLSGKKIRDLVFEDHVPGDSPVKAILRKHHFTLFRLRRSLLGPLLAPDNTVDTRPQWEPPNYLATLDPNRAIAKMKRRGWGILSSRR